MLATGLSLRDFRSYTRAEVRLGTGLTVVHGRNGAGKTNLLEALYMGCTGRSWRAANDRELVRFGARVARVELTTEAEDGPHAFVVALELGGRKRVTADGRVVERLADLATRPLVAVFSPDRLELVKGAPAARRAHLDQVVAALWPARADTRRAYARALAQRNALLSRHAAGSGDPSLDAWEAELARHGIELMRDRRRASDELARRFGVLAQELGLDGEPSLAYRPRSGAASADELAAELRARRQRDLDCRFTTHGPHRDDLSFRREGRELRAFGSQGQQRLAVLALLLSEREAIATSRGAAPLLLLDDALSELDPSRRERLIDRLVGPDSDATARGQTVITATDLALVPRADHGDTLRLAAAEGVVLAEAEAA